MKKLHQIVVVGGGAGGLELATALGRRLGRKGLARIVLVDASLTHIWKPLLHEVAAGTINSFEDELNYFAHGARHHFEFQLGRMDGLDRERKTLHLAPLTGEDGELLAEGRDLAYDTLVIAVGSTSNDFGTPGAHEHCIFLDSRAQADRFQKKLLQMYLQAHALPASSGAAPELNIAIVGAGATGVELAAELHHAAHEFAAYGLDEITPQHVNITLIEAAPRILTALPERAAEQAYRQLMKIGVTVLAGQRVTAVSAQGLRTASGLDIPASLRVWAAGIKAQDFLKDIGGLETNRINQLVVTPSLQTTRDDSVFAFGDCASCTLPGMERPLAPRAQVAHQQAVFLVKAISARLAHKPLPSFRFNDYGSLISLSSADTVGSLMGNLLGSVNIRGLVARLLYRSLYRMHQMSLHGVFRMLVLLGKDLLSRSSGPRLKLH
ncbi:MAG: ndh [Moraxellaceae bacterium]|jgi:NADH dehydrogenase|nr:ndh [Moraxellaceae bacterium]